MSISYSSAVQALHAAYGEDVRVRKYADTRAENIYGQSARDFGDPVTIRGQVERRVTDEVRTLMLLGADAIGMVSFGYADLEAAFPGEGLEWLDNADEVEIDGEWWRVTGVHPTGRVHGRTEIVTLGLKTPTQSVSP